MSLDLTSLFRLDGKLNTAVIRQPWFQQSELLAAINAATSWLHSDATLAEQVHCIQNGVTAIPQCVVCSKPAMFSKQAGKGYSPTCNSQACVTKQSASNRSKRAKPQTCPLTPYNSASSDWMGELSTFVGGAKEGNYIDAGSVCIYGWSEEFAPSTRRAMLESPALHHGQRVIHVIKSDWLTKRSVVTSRLAYLLGRCGRRIGARQCDIREVAFSEYSTFFESTHLQGNVPAKVCYGLYHGTELVAAMSFSRARYSKTHEWELLRMSTTINTVVPGAASRLFQHFVRMHAPFSVISYADRRWSTESAVYTSLGFSTLTPTPPGFSYVHPSAPHKLWSRVRFQSHKLGEMLKNHDPSLSAPQNMKNHGYVTLWDCGHYVYSYIPIRILSTGAQL